MKVAVQVKRLDGSIPLPEYQTSGAAGFDLAPRHDVEIGPMSFTLAPTGLIFATPPGHMLLVTPRSSTWKKWGVRLGNTVGVVDEDYCGDKDEVLLNLWNPSPSVLVNIPAGTRIAQGIFIPVLRAEFLEHDKMGLSRGGNGSTG